MIARRRSQFVLAVDLGTSGCKCALVGLDGVVYKWTFRSVPLHIVDGIGAEQAPEDWWSAFINSARELISTLPEVDGEIAAICCIFAGRSMHVKQENSGVPEMSHRIATKASSFQLLTDVLPL